MARHERGPAAFVAFAWQTRKATFGNSLKITGGRRLNHGLGASCHYSIDHRYQVEATFGP